MASPVRSLVDKIVGDLPDFIAERRSGGKSFDVIAREISELTDTYISGEAVRRWANEDAA